MLIKRKDHLKRITLKKLTLVTSLGVMFLLLPVVAMLIDPIFILAKYKFKVAKGSNIHKLLLSEMEGIRLSLYLFNITNAPQFQGGEDHKLKVREVGPFVYQEYRSNKDLEFDPEAKVVTFTPQVRTVFLPEESVGRPEDSILYLPNLPFLSTAALLSPYSFIMRNIFNVMASRIQPKSILKLSANEYLWGYGNPFVQTFQSLLPGLIYYNSTGILERLYDEKAEYRVVMGTDDVDKFKVKAVYKYIHGGKVKDTDEFHGKLEMNNTYEGAAFRSEMTPDMPLSVYRLGIWKTFQMKYVGKRHMEFGADAFIYDFDNKTFDNENLCDSGGLCPSGMADISDSFFGVPFTLSKAHLLDSEPQVLDRLEGIKPDREKDSSYILVEPRIGLTIDTSLLIQLNLVLNDLRYNQEASAFSDMVIPIVYCNFTFPELPVDTKSALSLMYRTGPTILLTLEISSCLLGLVLLAYSAKILHCYWTRQAHRSSVVVSPPLTQRATVEPLLVQE